MKKLTFVFGAIILGFMLTSCGEPVKDSIIKEIDNYFTDAEKQLSEINNSEDFLVFANVMSDRSDLLELLDEKFGGKKISDEDNEAVMNYASERATAYNNKEAEKAAEFITPALDDLEAVVDDLYTQFQSGEGLQDESVLKFNSVYGVFSDFIYYDNVLPEIQERYSVVGEKLEEMDDLLKEKLDVLFPEE
jgi:hypothetical protein